MLKGAGFLLFALFIDGLQAMLSLALTGVLAGVSLIPFIGQAVGAAAGPIGLVLGAAISICLSITMGGGLIAALALNGMFYPNKIIPAFAELMPGINNGPVWTIVVVRCMMQKYKEEHGRSVFSRKGEASVQEQVSAQPGCIVHSTHYTRPTTQASGAPVAQRQEGRAPGALKSLDGIRRPANDNQPLKTPSYVQKTA